MRRMLSAAAIVMLAVLVSGCAMVAQPDSDEVQEWLRSQERSNADAAVFMSGLSSALASDTGDSSEGVRADFGEPTDISAVEFSCFGSEKMSVTVQATGSSKSSSAEVEVSCSKTPVTLDIVQRSAISVSVNAYSAQDGGWSAAVR